jgi:hypothetical protein
LASCRHKHQKRKWIGRALQCEGNREWELHKALSGKGERLLEIWPATDKLNMQDELQARGEHRENQRQDRADVLWCADRVAAAKTRNTRIRSDSCYFFTKMKTKEGKMEPGHRTRDKEINEKNAQLKEISSRKSKPDLTGPHA